MLDSETLERIAAWRQLPTLERAELRERLTRIIDRQLRLAHSRNDCVCGLLLLRDFVEQEQLDDKVGDA